MNIGDNILSDEITVKSGVPQGSSLSHLLFLCFINDLKKRSETVNFYYLQIIQRHNDLENVFLQEVFLSELGKTKWNLTFTNVSYWSSTKYSHLRISVILVLSPFYLIHEFNIGRVQLKFLRWIAFKNETPPSQINYYLLHENLKGRRINFQIIFIHELANNFTYLLEKLQLNTNHVYLRNREVFKIHFNPTNYIVNNPIERVLRDAN